MPEALNLEQAGRKLRSARRSLQTAMDTARDAALTAIHAGESESAVAKTLGVDRMTVRKWVGK